MGTIKTKLVHGTDTNPRAHSNHSASPRRPQLKIIPERLGEHKYQLKTWLGPGVIDEPSHLHNEIQIEAEITNVMKGKRLVKINEF